MRRIFFKFSVFFAGVEADSLEETIESPISFDISHLNSQQTPQKKKQITENHFFYAKQEKITRAKVRMIAMYQLPLPFVHSDRFMEFMKIIKPNYRVPYPQAIRVRLEVAYDKIRKEITEHLIKASSAITTND